MSYKDYFSRYGDQYSAETPMKYRHITRISKLDTLEKVVEADNNALSIISEAEKLIANMKEYRADLAARYAALDTMLYHDRLTLTRRKYDTVNFYLSIDRVFEDGTEQELLREHFTGKDRRAAFARFEALKKAHPGIEVVQDTEKRAWER